MDFNEAYDDTCSTVVDACMTGNVDALKALIAAGKPVDSRDSRGWCPLHVAAYHAGQPECLEILLQHRATPSRASTAVFGDLSGSLEKLDESTVNWKTYKGETALYLASKIGNIDGIKLLLRHGADVNLTTKEKLSPLWEATGKNRLACMHVLVAAGADVNQQTYTGNTPLHSAAARGNTETVTFLLDKGADMSVRANDGRTPVFTACQFANHEFLKIMLERADQTLSRWEYQHIITRAGIPVDQDDKRQRYRLRSITVDGERCLSSDVETHIC